MNTKRFLSLVCVLLAALMLLCACNKDSGDDEIFGTTAEKKTKATTVTTEPPVAEEIPQLVPEILEQDTNLVLGRLVEPVVRPINEDVSIELNYQGWPSACAGDGNTLYAVSSVRIAHIDPYGCIGFYKSVDGGKTWEGPEIIADTPVDDRDAGIVYLGNGKILVSWFTRAVSNYMPGGQWDAWQKSVTDEQKAATLEKLEDLPALEKEQLSYVMLSEDGGKTWNEPTMVPVSAPHGPSLMNDGKTLIYFGDPHGAKYCGFENFKSGSFYMIVSTDWGKTWRHQATIPLVQTSSYGFDEPYVLQLKDGSFIAGVRAQVKDSGNEGLCIFTTHSQDGRNWTPLEKLEGVVGTPPHFFQTEEGVLVLTYSYRVNPAGVHGRLSYDGGYTWTDEFVLSDCVKANNWDLGYPCTTQLPDGTLITVYYSLSMSGDSFKSILYTRWKLVEK